MEEAVCTQPEGKTVQLFRVRMRGFFKNTADSVSLEEFREIYGDLLKEKQAKRLFKVWKEKVYEEMENELDSIITEEKLDEKLTNLSKVIDECKLDRNKIAWRPPGNPTEHMRSLDMHHKHNFKRDLEEFVRQKEAAVQDLMKEVQAGRTEVLELERRLQDEMNAFHNLSKEEKNTHAVLQQHMEELRIKE